MFNRQKCWMVTHAALSVVLLGFCSLALAQQPLPDPTRPVVTSGVGAPVTQKADWKLSTILIAPQRRVAVINDQVVKVGQKINGAKLIAVKPDSAVLFHAGKTIQLKLISGTVKQAAVPAP